MTLAQSRGGLCPWHVSVWTKAMAPHLQEAADERPLLATSSSENSTRTTLHLSLLLNVVCFLLLLAGTLTFVRKQHASDNILARLRVSSGGNWWLEAVAEAQRASESSCSGHGKVYVDTMEGSGCECNECFTGKDCSEKIVDCKANADGGDPLFLEPFWEMNAEAGAVVIAPTHRMSYSVDEGRAITRQLEKLIRQVHEFVGNAVTEDRFIVIGTGSMELVNAAISSLSPGRMNSFESPAVVVSRVPYYGTYRTQTEQFSSTQYVWEGDPVGAAAKFSNSNASYIELVSAPNNPDGSMLGPVLNNSITVFDRAYYWPHYTPITKAVDDAMTLFTLSKLTGHAGSRLGWAIVKDREVYEKMKTYVNLNTIGVSHDSQLRAVKLLKAVLAGYQSNAAGAGDKHKLFHFGRSKMDSRWKRLRGAFQDLNMFNLHVMDSPEPCIFFKSARSPSPAYAWVKCEDDAVTDCHQFFSDSGIIGYPGTSFGADSKHVRFTLLRRDDDFDNFIDHLVAMSLPLKAIRNFK